MEKYFVHGKNLKGKLDKEKNIKQIELLKEILSKYEVWTYKNIELIDTSITSIKKRVKWLNEYMDFINIPKYRKEKGSITGFTSQSKLHSSVLEEFLFYLFKDITKVKLSGVALGPINAYTNLFFAPSNIETLSDDPGLSINLKNQDFAISKSLTLIAQVESSKKSHEEHIYIPIVSIECKTYIDKTMYEGSVATADKIKKGNPYALFIVVAETYDISEKVDPKYSSIDQIFVLRKQRAGIHKKNPIYADLVYDLFKMIENHINSDWRQIKGRIERGKMI